MHSALFVAVVDITQVMYKSSSRFTHNSSHYPLSKSKKWEQYFQKASTD